MYGKWEKSDEGDLLVSNKYWETSHYYNYGAYSDWYGYGYNYEPIPKPTTKPTTQTKDILGSALIPYTKAEIDEQWKKLEREKFVWFDDLDMLDALLDSADEIEGDYVTKDGRTYIFSEEEMCAWDTTIDYEE
jgi:hypothetical protein